MCLTHLLVNQFTIQNITSKHNERKSKRQNLQWFTLHLGYIHFPTTQLVMESFSLTMQILYKQLQTTPFTPRKDQTTPTPKEYLEQPRQQKSSPLSYPQTRNHYPSVLFSKRTLHSQSETRITTRFTKEKDTYNLSDFWMNADDYAAKKTSKDAEKI